MKSKEKLTKQVKVMFDDTTFFTISKLANKESLTLSEFIRKYMNVIVYGLAHSIDEGNENERD